MDLNHSVLVEGSDCSDIEFVSEASFHLEMGPVIPVTGLDKLCVLLEKTLTDRNNTFFCQNVDW